MHAGLSVEAVPSPLTSALLFPPGFFDTRFLLSLHAKLHIHSVRLTSNPAFKYAGGCRVDHRVIVFIRPFIRN